ncbi:MAG: hypothetical protein AAF843_07800 [Bacteroidota bacterium]
MEGWRERSFFLDLAFAGIVLLVVIQVKDPPYCCHLGEAGVRGKILEL